MLLSLLDLLDWGRFVFFRLYISRRRRKICTTSFPWRRGLGVISCSEADVLSNVSVLIVSGVDGRSFNLLSELACRLSRCIWVLLSADLEAGSTDLFESLLSSPGEDDFRVAAERSVNKSC